MKQNFKNSSLDSHTRVFSFLPLGSHELLPPCCPGFLTLHTPPFPASLIQGGDIEPPLLLELTLLCKTNFQETQRFLHQRKFTLKSQFSLQRKKRKACQTPRGGHIYVPSVPFCHAVAHLNSYLVDADVNDILSSLMESAPTIDNNLMRCFLPFHLSIFQVFMVCL